MSTDTKTVKRRFIIGGMAVIALCSNFYFLDKVQAKHVEEIKTQKAQANEAIAQKEAQNAAMEHAQYVGKYVGSGFPVKTGNRNVAFAVASEDGKLNRTVTTALASHFQNGNAHVLQPFFKSEFVTDGLFNDALSGSGELFRKLDLAKSVDALVLARQDVTYGQSAAMENLVSATMRLDVVVVPVSGQGDSKTWSFTAVGPGFTKEVARGAAEERLIKQIAADTKMSLDPFFQNLQFR